MKNKKFKEILDSTTEEQKELVRLKTDLRLWQSTAKELAEALEDLLTEQNGPPLIRYQEAWEAAVKRSNDALEQFKNLTDEQLKILEL